MTLFKNFFEQYDFSFSKVLLKTRGYHKKVFTDFNEKGWEIFEKCSCE